MAQLKTGTTIGGRDIVQEFDSHKNDKVAHIDYAVASGTNTYTANIQGITALVEGLSVKIKFQNANTGASTLNINGLGAKQIRKSNGNALSAGNIKAGQICHLVYNGVNFQLLGEGGEYGTAQPEHVLEGYTIGTDEGLKEGTMANKGSLSVTPGSSSKSYEAGYYSSIYVAGDSNLKSENIKSGKTIFGVSGKSSVVDTEDATATASNILSGKTAYVNGSKLTGTMSNNGSQSATLTISGSSKPTKTIPEGYTSGGTIRAELSSSLASVIKEGEQVGGVTGTLKAALDFQQISDVTSKLERAPLCIDRDGNIYLVTQYDSYEDNVAKYNKYGNLIWRTSLTDTSDINFIEVSPDGSRVFACGYNYWGGNYEGILICINSSTGAQIWRRAYGVDEGDEYYGEFAQLLVTKNRVSCYDGADRNRRIYDYNGSFLRTMTDTFSYEYAADDKGDYFYRIASSSQSFIAKYDAEHNQIWQVNFDSGTTGDMVFAGKNYVFSGSKIFSASNGSIIEDFSGTVSTARGVTEDDIGIFVSSTSGFIIKRTNDRIEMVRVSKTDKNYFGGRGKYLLGYGIMYQL